MKHLGILICTASSLAANFDVQTSWFRNSSIDAEGAAPQPDVIDQTITGDPMSQYEETYRILAGREENGAFSVSRLDYQIISTSSLQGMVPAYNYRSSSRTFGVISGDLTSTTSYSYSTSTIFTTNESFSLESALLTDGGQIQDFSLFVDDILLWSGLSGFSGPLVPDLGGGLGDTFATYGENTDFQITILGSEATLNPSDIRYVKMAVDFGELEPEHKFEVRFGWSRTDTNSDSGDLASFDYNLDLAAVPEPSAGGIVFFSLVAALGIRRRHH